MIDCRTCSHCTYIHEYEMYICGLSNGRDKLAYRVASDSIVSEPDCPDYEEYKED